MAQQCLFSRNKRNGITKNTEKVTCNNALQISNICKDEQTNFRKQVNVNIILGIQINKIKIHFSKWSEKYDQLNNKLKKFIYTDKQGWQNFGHYGKIDGKNHVFYCPVQNPYVQNCPKLYFSMKLYLINGMQILTN